MDREVMLKNGYWDTADLRGMGLSCGNNSYVAKTCKLVNPQNIDIGVDCRIDDFCLLLAGSHIRLGDRTKLSPYTYLNAGKPIVFMGYCAPSSHLAVYGETNVYNGEWWVNSAFPELNRYKGAGVLIKEGVAIGARTTIISSGVQPLVLGWGCGVAAHSLVMSSVPKAKMVRADGVHQMVIGDRSIAWVGDVLRKFDLGPDVADRWYEETKGVGGKCSGWRLFRR